MAARYPSMIAAINLALLQKKKICEVPINHLCYDTLSKLREIGIITGFSVEKCTTNLENPKYFSSILNSEMEFYTFSHDINFGKKEKKKKPYPRAKIFLPLLPLYIRLKTYPLQELISSEYVKPIFSVSYLFAKPARSWCYLLLTIIMD
jgi:hypothetical protein